MQRHRSIRFRIDYTICLFGVSTCQSVSQTVTGSRHEIHSEWHRLTAVHTSPHVTSQDPPRTATHQSGALSNRQRGRARSAVARVPSRTRSRRGHAYASWGRVPVTSAQRADPAKESKDRAKDTSIALARSVSHGKPKDVRRRVQRPPALPPTPFAFPPPFVGL